jgi:hypothetical protein
VLSIIISSYQENFYSALEKNIGETIGIPYEIIKIHNPGKMGICEAYNKGASKSKHDYLLFMHEDVLFCTENWGELLINHLKTENTGVIGLAGSNYVPIAPSSWCLTRNKYNFANVNKNNIILNNQENSIKPSNKVFALDGLFLAVKESVYHQFLFDESVKGFHGYDTDFSLRVATKYNNYVVWDIFIKHFSKGYPDKTWLDNNILIRNKIKHHFNEVYDSELEIEMFNFFLNNYFEFYKYNLKSIKITLNFLPSKLTLKEKFIILDKYLRKLYYFSKKINLLGIKNIVFGKQLSN